MSTKIKNFTLGLFYAIVMFIGLNLMEHLQWKQITIFIGSIVLLAFLVASTIIFSDDKIDLGI